MSSILNKAQFRKFVLALADKNRHHEYTRVSDDFIQRAEANLRVWTLQQLHAMPSKGKTIK